MLNVERIGNVTAKANATNMISLMRLPFRLIGFSAALLVLSGCNDAKLDSKSMNSASASGRQEIKLRVAHATEESGDLAGAEKIFTQIAAQSPPTVAGKMELADFYLRHHEEARATEALQDALKLEPGNSDIARELANTYISMGQPGQALALLNESIDANPRNALLYNSRGVALDQMGDYARAQKSYKMAYDIDPVGGTTYKINISMSYILSGAYDKAIAILRPMLDTPDSPAIVRQNLALAYGLKGDSEEAEKLGLQDLSESEVQENIRFYRMLAHKNNPNAPYPSGTAPVPASVVQDLFPESEPAGAALKVEPVNVPPAVSTPPAIEAEPEAKHISPTPLVEPQAPPPDAAALPLPVLRPNSE